MRRIRFSPGWLLAALLLLAGCSGEENSPEARIRQLLAQAEQAVERRSLDDSLALLADDYHDSQGHDRKAIARALFVYFQRNRQIHLLTRVSDIRLHPQEGSADVTLLVATAGVPLESFDALVSIRADLHRFDLLLRETGDDWLIQSAQWRRAQPADFGL